MKKFLQIFTFLLLQNTQSQTTSFYAGSTSAASGFVDANGTAAKFVLPYGFAKDNFGNLYVADSQNHKIRKIDLNGNVTTIAGTTSGYEDGNISVAKFNNPTGLAVDSNGNVYVADLLNHKIRKIDINGNVTTIAGSTQGNVNGIGTAAKFRQPFRLAIGTQNSIFVVDRGNNIIRKIDSSNNVTTFAGSVYGYSDGVGNTARFAEPRGIFIDSNFDIYIADGANQKIRKIAIDGTVSTFANNVNAWGLIKSSDGNFYVADGINNCVRKISTDGQVTVYAGTANIPTNNNGGFLTPYDIIERSNGSLFIVDTNAHNIKMISQPLNLDSIFKNNIGFYPNPTTTNINISFQNNLEKANIKVISILGQTVLEKQNISGTNLSLDVSGLPMGTYIIQVSDGVSVTSSKFIKQ